MDCLCLEVPTICKGETLGNISQNMVPNTWYSAGTSMNAGPEIPIEYIDGNKKATISMAMP